MLRSLKKKSIWHVGPRREIREELRQILVLLQRERKGWNLFSPEAKSENPCTRIEIRVSQ